MWAEMRNLMIDIYSLFEIQAQEVNTAQPQEAAQQSADIVNHLATITTPTEGASVLPLDLGITVDVINTVVRCGRYHMVYMY